MEKIVTNEELQEGLTAHLRDVGGEETTGIARTYSSLAGKILSSVKLDMEAADKLGKKYLSRTYHFLGRKE